MNTKVSFFNFFHHCSFFLFQKTGGLGSLGTSTSVDPHLSVGLIVPYSRFQERKYLSQIKKSVYNVNKESTDGFSFLKKYKFGCGVIKRCQDVKMIMLPSSPSPRRKTY